MSAPSKVQSAASPGANPGTSCSVTLPSEPTPGNLLVLVVSSRSDFPVPTDVGEWTLRELHGLQTGGAAIFTRTADGSEQTVAVETDTSAGTLQAALYEFAHSLGTPRIADGLGTPSAASALSVAIGPLAVEDEAFVLAYVAWSNPATGLAWTGGFSSDLALPFGGTAIVADAAPGSVATVASWSASRTAEGGMVAIVAPPAPPAVVPAVDPADAVQAGIYDLLTGDIALMGLVNGVFDSVPEGTAQPYVVLGAMQSVPDGSHDGEGRQTTAELHTWTRTDSFAPANAIGAQIVALLWHRHADLDVVVDGHKVWRVEHEFAQTLVDPEPGIRRRVDRFRIWTSQGS